MKAVITGGAMGIGYAAAKAFRQKGYDVLIIDICESGAESAKEIGADFVKCDVSDAAAVKATAESTGKVDVVVCNAAVQTVCDWDEVDYDDFRKIIDVNLCGAFYTAHAFSRYMKLLRTAGGLPFGELVESAGLADPLKGGALTVTTKRAVELFDTLK